MQVCAMYIKIGIKKANPNIQNLFHIFYIMFIFLNCGIINNCKILKAFASMDSVSVGSGIVAMQMETLDAVHRESRRLPPIQKVSMSVTIVN